MTTPGGYTNLGDVDTGQRVGLSRGFSQLLGGHEQFNDLLYGRTWHHSLMQETHTKHVTLLRHVLRAYVLARQRSTSQQHVNVARHSSTLRWVRRYSGAELGTCMLEVELVLTSDKDCSTAYTCDVKVPGICHEA